MKSLSAPTFVMLIPYDGKIFVYDVADAYDIGCNDFTFHSYKLQSSSVPSLANALYAKKA